MRAYWKKVLAFGLCIVLVMGLCACGEKDSWLFSVHDEIIKEEDVAAFVYIYLTEYNVRNVEQLQSIYEDKTTYGEYYKQQLERDVIETMLLYREAKEEKVSLSDEVKEQMKVNVENVIERFGEESLREHGVSKSDIEEVYRKKMLGEEYLDKVLGDVEEQEVEEIVQPSRYIHVFQVTFPTVQLDETGMLMSDADGNLKKVSQAELELREQEANAFAESLQQGESMETLLEDCHASVTGMEKYLKYEDLESEYKKAVDEISQGEYSEVISSDYGFYVVELLDADDEEYAEMMVSQEVESEQTNVRVQEVKRLYSEYIQMNREYKNPTLWDEFEIENYIE